MFRRLCGLVGASGVVVVALRRPLSCSAEPSASSPSTDKRRKLQLHFDINKTLIVSDPVGGKDTYKMINSLLSEVVWGKVNDKGEWEIVSKFPSNISPARNDSSVMTFGEYLENVKFKFEKGTGAEIKESNSQKKAQGTKLKTCFTEPGQLGEVFRRDYENVIVHLALPDEVKAKADPRVFKNGQCFILPAFFHLLVYLQQQKRDFSLTFRSFGTEIAEVAAEHNLFCTGKHPLFPNSRADGTQGSFFVDAEDSKGTSLTLGSLKPGKEHGETLNGYPAIYNFFTHRGAGTWGIRDYYPWWQSHQESETTGKLLLVDVSDSSVLPVFFDDNIERDRAHIVNVRNAQTGEPIPFAKAQKHLVRAEPYLAITDPHYFIRALNECEKLA